MDIWKIQVANRLLAAPFLIILVLTWQTEGRLLGDHVCETKLTVPQQVLKWELKNRTTRTYKWCMNVPPRCSVYSTKLVNETRISVINVTKSIEACCDGFREQNNACVSRCQECQNGLCVSGFCACQAGWGGTRCDSRIAKETSALTPIGDGVSTLTSFLSTTPNELLFSSSTYQSPTDSFITSTKKPNERLDEGITTISSIFSKGLNTTKTLFTTRNPILEHFLTFYKQYSSRTTQNPYVEDVEGSGSTSTYKPSLEEGPYFDTTATQPINTYPTVFIEDTNLFDGKEDVKENLLPNTGEAENILDYRELDRETSKESVLNSSLRTNAKSHEDNDMEEEMGLSTTSKSIIAIQSEENVISKENLLKGGDDFIGERYEKRSSMENFGENMTVTEPAGKNLIYSICAAALTTFLILVVAVTLYAVRSSRKKMEKNKPKKEVATVAVYTASIFHTPLPELPTIDNPTYLTSGQVKGESIEVPEFNIIFQKPIRHHPTLDCKQYLYDHPPSTGSYRASSEVDTLSQYNFSQRSAPGLVSEPLYDEIPSRDIENNVPVGDQRSISTIDSNCLYMNTCGRTKF